MSEQDIVRGERVLVLVKRAQTSWTNLLWEVVRKAEVRDGDGGLRAPNLVVGGKGHICARAQVPVLGRVGPAFHGIVREVDRSFPDRGNTEIGRTVVERSHPGS